jgi:hypothetical protein
MLTVQVTQVICCTPDELLRFVIRPVRWVREGNVVEFAFRGCE